MTWRALFGERSTTKIVGIFEHEKEALESKDKLKGKIHLRDTQLKVVSPDEKHYGRKLEPEDRGIARTAVRSHVIFGVVGFLAGILIWGIIYAIGWDALRSSPGMAAVPILFFSTVGGLMLGGLLTARPDHEIVILHVRDAVEQGKWSLVVHPRTSAESDQAEAMLNEVTSEVWRSV